MTTWTRDELSKVGTAEELETAPLRRDGLTRPCSVAGQRARLGSGTEYCGLYAATLKGLNAAFALTTHTERPSIVSQVSPT